MFLLVNKLQRKVVNVLGNVFDFCPSPLPEMWALLNYCNI